MALSYKEMHEQFVSNLNGTTSTETFLLITPSVLGVFLARLLSARRAQPPHRAVSALSVLILAVVYYPTTISTPTQVNSCLKSIFTIPLHQRSTGKRKTIVRVLNSCVPLLMLGGVRFFTAKQIDHQIHVSEYGVHRNFFITLAVSKLSCSLLSYFYNPKFSFLVSVLLIVIHEIVLKSGIEQWVLSDMERTDFLSANREGIVSCLGYLAIFVAGEGIGHYIFHTREFFKEHIRLNYRLALLSAFLWFLMLITEDVFPASRRLANFRYYLWILTVSTITLTLFLFCDLLYILYRFYIQNCGGLRHVEKEEIHIPIILDAVSFNVLPFFLIANLLTGFVNMCPNIVCGCIY